MKKAKTGTPFLARPLFVRSPMLRTRLYLGLLPLLLLVMATGGFAIHRVRDLAGSLSRDLLNNYRSVVANQQMRTAVTLMNTSLNRKKRKMFEDNRAAFMRDITAQSLMSRGSGRARFVNEIEAEFRKLVQRGEQQLLAQGSGTIQDIVDNSAAMNAVHAALDRLTQHDVAAAQGTSSRVESLASETERVMLLTIAGGFVLSLFLMWRLATALLEPIRMFTAQVVALGEGDLERKVPELSRDELGQLARAFNTMAARLRAYRDATLAKALRAQRTMEATLTSTPEPVFVLGRDGTHEVRNPAAEQLSRSSEFASGFPEALTELVQEVLRTGEHYLPTDYSKALTFRVEREDRHYIPRILAIGDTLTEFSGAAIILQDVTRFRLLDDAKTNLVGTVSHELKTPLTSLRMALYLLLEQNLSALSRQQRELLEDARDDADRLLRILDSLLDLTRLESGASSLERTEIGVSVLLRRIAGEAHPFIDAAGQRLVVIVAPELTGVTCNVDEARLRHVFINLLTNASKYTPEGELITLSASEEAGGFIRFAVRDRGPGIPAESVGRVFDRFYRAPNQDRRTGAGLGLAIAREIVVAHGGSIACTSTEGEGSEFYFLIPR